MRRIYETLMGEHLQQHRQMVFLTGPRQVGKTTTGRVSAGPGHRYFNWDVASDRLAITRGPSALAEEVRLSTLQRRPAVVVLDEIHKFARWKTFLKGWFDAWGDRARTIVTGSARLDVFRRGGDSLMGRFLLYRMHPLSLAEIRGGRSPEDLIRPPRKPGTESLRDLLAYGGFPEPFLKASARFAAIWRRFRADALFREDLRDLTRVHEMGQMQVLALLLEARAGQPVNLSHLAADASVSVDTVRRWIRILESVYHCFTIRPWFRNVGKSLRKQPKVFLWDWSRAANDGARKENLIASHLLKAVHWWTDCGLGVFDLHYVRDKMKREVDFLVTRDANPWFLVEVKSSGQREISASLSYHQRQIRAAHAFQVEFDAPYVDRDCFEVSTPVRVPAATLLSQLV